MLLFYSARDEKNPRMNAYHLKKSLSDALTHFYPLAGRIKDSLTIDCNDEGATFIEAQVACDMSLVLEEPEVDVLQQLLPCDQLTHLPLTHHSTSDQEMLAVQVNYFACGGMAICASISHVVADASAAASFLKGWSEVSCDAGKIKGVVYDCSSLFPPRDLSILYRFMTIAGDKNHVESPEDKVVTKRFLFDASKVAALRNELGDGLESYHPTRFEAVTALFGEALVAATAENAGTSTKIEALYPVNLRNRLNPPLPQQCIGNVCFVTKIPIEKTENRNIIARKVHESIKLMDDGYIRKMFSGPRECFDNFMKMTLEEFEKNSNVGMFWFSSCCKFPFYKTDFGWGNPVWFGCAMGIKRSIYLVDTSDGEGIEVWIALTKGEMAKLEQQPGILAYATFKPSI